MGRTVLSVLIICALQNVLLADQCPRGEPVEHFNIHGETKPSIFDDLTMDEITAVYNYMRGVKEFNILDGHDVVVNCSYIYLIDQLPPPKAEALVYLDQNGVRPKRFAAVTLFRGDAIPPVIEEYKVGPLPAIEGYELLLGPGGKRSIDYIKRSMFTPVEVQAIVRVMEKEVSKVDEILKQVVGYTMTNCGSKCLEWAPGLPGKYANVNYGIWFALYRKHEGSFLHPIGLEFRINTKNHDMNENKWKVDFVWMQGEVYSSFEEMNTKYTIPGNVDPPQYEDTATLYSSLNQRGGPLPEKEQRGPRSFMPDGRRYTVKGHHVQWQGWSFDFNLRTVAGLQMHDIKFKGERIVYELGLSEIGIMYGGETPAVKHSLFLDSSFLLGALSMKLFPLIDCPDHATYFDFAHLLNSRAVKYRRSACLFEHASSVPLRRHTEANFVTGQYYFAHGMPGNVLILRSLVTVANYEYILDYKFHQNGALEVVVSLSGYILSSYRTFGVGNRHGFEVHPGIAGQIHNHLVQFKVDLDVLGTSNRFETLDVKIKNIEDPADPGTMINVHAVEENLRRTEKNATYKFNFDMPKYLIFQNAKEENKMGNPRSYRLLTQGIGKQMLPTGWAVERSFSWSRYQVAVTRQKDEEVRGSSIYNQGNLYDPHVNFQSFIDDDESIVDQDLVAWVALGTFHIPHSEDLPIVQTPGLSLSFYLLPYNFFEEDPSLASRDNMRFSPKRGGGLQYSGAKVGVNCDPTLMANVDDVQSGAIKYVHSPFISVFFYIALSVKCYFVRSL